ncbi:MAG: HDOD domain-containing protein [Opitutaceae bacterium]
MTVASSLTGLSLNALRTGLESSFQSGVVALPVLPQVAARVMTMANDPNADVADLSDLIHQDQSLAGNVLRIANSAAYCVGEPVVSLRQAVMRLGMTLLSEIAVTACLMGENFRTPGYESLRKKLLVHAFIAGGFAKELARQKRRNVEAMFLCGLLHSIGKPVALRLICNLQADSRSQITETDIEGLVNQYHTRAADLVMQAWDLPEQVRLTTLHHPDPESAPAFQDESRMTRLAASLADCVVDPEPVDENTLRGFPDWEPLNFYPDDVEAVLARREALEKSATVFMS